MSLKASPVKGDRQKLSHTPDSHLEWSCGCVLMDQHTELRFGPALHLPPTPRGSELATQSSGSWPRGKLQ